MIGRSLSSHRLKSTSLHSPSRVHKATTLFPFFNSSGHVQHILALLPGQPPSVIPSPDLQTGWKIRVKRPLSNYVQLDDDQANILFSYWHFDPWWMLDDPQFQGATWVSTLKSTNCVDLFEENTKVIFGRKDFKVLGLLLPSGEFKKYRGQLPKREPKKLSSMAAHTWQLNRRLFFWS